MKFRILETDLLEIQVCRFGMANLAWPVLRGSHVRKSSLCRCFTAASEEGIGHLSGIIPRAIHGVGFLTRAKLKVKPTN